MVYALLVERIERHVLVEQQIVAAAIQRGAEVEFPTFDERLAEFDEALLLERAQVDGEQAELMAALGVG